MLALEYTDEFNLDNIIDPVLIVEDNIGDAVEYVCVISVVLAVDNAFKYLLISP